MDRAESIALEAYPVSMGEQVGWRCVDFNEIKRKTFAEGYEQAEQDNALTAEDMKLAFRCVNETIDNCDGNTKKEIYEDALRRFNSIKADKR